jgi:tubulin monoglycylase TTLL3/8
MTGWYPCVKEALLARGWHFNPDPTSPYFNLKWTLRSLEVSQETLQPWQLTNHYLKNVAITTKAGLIKSLQSLVWTADVEANDIIPRGYDLSNNMEMQAFLDDFRSQKAESVLKALYLQLTGLELPAMNRNLGPLPSPRATVGGGDSDSAEGTADEEDGNAAEKQSQAKSGIKAASSVDAADSVLESDEPEFPPVPALAPGVVLANISVNSAVFEAILAVLEKQIKPYEDSYIDDRDAHTEKMITDLEWELISKYKIDQSFPGLPVDVPEPVDAFLKEKEDMDVKPTAAQLREKRRQAKQEEEAREEASQRAKVMRPLTMPDLERIHNTLCALMHHNKYQTGLNGKGDKSLNMWIVKPAAKSRGRGITTFMDLNKLLKYVDAGTGRYSQWVVQKYMENPLIVANRKFDLRQWVVVTNWNPLTVWFYDECYARFSVEEYSTDAADLTNAFIHLVNNSIGKNSENFNKLITAENGVPVEGYMWSFDQIADFMQFKSGGQEMMRSKVHPRMKVRRIFVLKQVVANIDEMFVCR